MKVLLTDYPWQDLSIEREILGRAGLELVVGTPEALPAAEIEAMVRAHDPVAIATCWSQVNAAAIMAPSQLRIVARLGVGLDNIDVASASARGAWVSNVPDYCVPEVADHALALTLAFERGIVRLDHDVKSRGWHAPLGVPRRINELVVGIIGYGRIGRETARRFAQLGCNVLAHSPSRAADDAVSRAATIADIQEKADVIIINAPLTPETKHLLDAPFFAACRAKPLIVNVSRGGLIDNTALIDALGNGQIRGAALDVIEGEPNPPAEVLARSDVIVTPHIAYLSDASLIALRRTACEEVVRALRGEQPVNARNEDTRAQTGVTLPGGVSSDIELAEIDGVPVVIKAALPKLKVAADWHSDPERSGVEVRAIAVAAELIGPDAVPRVIWNDPANHRFAMEHVGLPMRNWKQELLAGRVDQRMMVRAGALLAELHVNAAARPELACQWADKTYFEQLRVRPFFEATAVKLPVLAEHIRAVSADMSKRASTFVHGDFSPKNLLIDGDRIVLLDFEVAHWGDPAFDVAFFISHLLLKSLRRGLPAEELRSATANFLAGYHEKGGPAADDRHLGDLIACLMLARSDGDSPVEYLSAAEKQQSRAFATEMLETHPQRFADVLQMKEFMR